jgi:hypothetical protein
MTMNIFQMHGIHFNVSNIIEVALNTINQPTNQHVVIYVVPFSIFFNCDLTVTLLLGFEIVRLDELLLN